MHGENSVGEARCEQCDNDDEVFQKSLLWSKLQNKHIQRWNLSTWAQTNILSFSLNTNDFNEFVVHEVRVPRLKSFRQSGGDLKREEKRKEKEQSYCQWYITLTDCVATLSDEYPIDYLSIGQWSTIDNKEWWGSYHKLVTQKCRLVDYVTFGIG